MPKASALAVLALAGLAGAQDGQQGPRPGWPCVPGRAVDPAYLEVSESSGGQLFLFQPGELEHASTAMMAPYTHPATVLRAVGHLNGERDFEFPVDSGVESILVLASLQCRAAIRISRPGGAEMTSANSALSIDLQAGRILRVDAPDPGKWNVRLAGTGLFVLSVAARADVSLAGVKLARASGGSQELEARIAGEVSDVRFQFVDAGGDAVTEPAAVEAAAGGVYRAAITPRAGRFRLRVTGTTSAGWPFQRTHPVLFRAAAPPEALAPRGGLSRP